MICHESHIAHRSDARVEHLVLPGSALRCRSSARRRMTMSTNGYAALVRTRSPFAQNTLRTRLGLAKRIRSAALRRGEARVRFFIRTRILALPHRQSRVVNRDPYESRPVCQSPTVPPSHPHPVLEAPLYVSNQSHAELHFPTSRPESTREPRSVRVSACLSVPNCPPP